MLCKQKATSHAGGYVMGRLNCLVKKTDGAVQTGGSAFRPYRFPDIFNLLVWFAPFRFPFRFLCAHRVSIPMGNIERR